MSDPGKVFFRLRALKRRANNVPAFSMAGKTLGLPLGTEVGMRYDGQGIAQTLSCTGKRIDD
jgi:hypothetical protein